VKVYLIPGIGSDGRLYDQMLATGMDAEVLEWFTPLPDESFNDYIRRFAKQINTGGSFAIIGTSFGGIMAVELARILNPDKLIIISSVKCRAELPPYVRIGKYISLFRSSTGLMYNRVNRILLKILRLGIQQKFLDTVIEMSQNADEDFIRWAIDKVMKWENKNYPHRILHIHGTYDALFPIIFIKDCVRIEGGTHTMVIERADEINKLVLAHLEE